MLSLPAIVWSEITYTQQLCLLRRMVVHFTSQFNLHRCIHASMIVQGPNFQSTFVHFYPQVKHLCTSKKKGLEQRVSN